MVTYNQEKNQSIKTGQYMTETMYKYLNNWTRPNNKSSKSPNSNPRVSWPLHIVLFPPPVLTSLSASVAIYKILPWQSQCNFPVFLVCTSVRTSQKLAEVDTDLKPVKPVSDQEPAQAILMDKISTLPQNSFVSPPTLLWHLHWHSPWPPLSHTSGRRSSASGAVAWGKIRISVNSGSTHQ